jgi:hypothetical protein
MATVDEYIQAKSPWNPADSDMVLLISMAEEEIGDCYGDLRNKAVALLTLHWKALKEREGNTGFGTTGSLKSEKEGDLSRSYGFAGSAEIRDPYMGQTTYGLELLTLEKQLFIKPRNRMVDGC